MAKIATVAAVTGNAVVVGLDGTVRALKVGDVIQKGEIIRTAAGARVELIMEDGQTMAVAPEHTVRIDEAVAQTEATPAAQEAAVQSGTVDQILQVLEQGGDLTQELEAAAAGGGAGSGGDGSDFVRLLRVTEGTDPLAYSYNFAPLPEPDEVVLSAEAPVASELPPLTIKIFAVDFDGETYTIRTAPVAEGTTAYYVALPVDQNGNLITVVPAGTVNITFGGGNATPGANGDYQANNVTVQLGQVFTAAVLDDYVADNGEVYGVDVDGFTGAADYSSVTYIGTTTTIVDDSNPDTPEEPDEPNQETVTIQVFAVVDGELVPANSVPEGTAATYVVHAVDPQGNIIEGAAGTVDITFTDVDATGGTDYVSTTLTGIELGVEFTTDALDDYIADHGETFEVSAGNYSDAATYENVAYGEAVTTTITDNDVAPTIDDAEMSVSEEGLAAGFADDEPIIPLDADTTNDAVRSGTIAITGNGPAPLSIEFDLESAPDMLGDTAVTWRYEEVAGEENKAVLIASDGTQDVVRVTLNSGDTVVNEEGGTPPASVGYTVELLAPLAHTDASKEDTLVFSIGFLLSDGANDPAIGTLTVTVEDDMPVAVQADVESLTIDLIDGSDTGALGIQIGADLDGAKVTLSYLGGPILTSNDAVLTFYADPETGGLYAATSEDADPVLLITPVIGDDGVATYDVEVVGVIDQATDTSEEPISVQVIEHGTTTIDVTGNFAGGSLQPGNYKPGDTPVGGTLSGVDGNGVPVGTLKFWFEGFKDNNEFTGQGWASYVETNVSVSGQNVGVDSNQIANSSKGDDNLDKPVGDGDGALLKLYFDKMVTSLEMYFDQLDQGETAYYSVDKGVTWIDVNGTGTGGSPASDEKIDVENGGFTEVWIRGSEDSQFGILTGTIVAEWQETIPTQTTHNYTVTVLDVNGEDQVLAFSAQAEDGDQDLSGIIDFDVTLDDGIDYDAVSVTGSTVSNFSVEQGDQLNFRDIFGDSNMTVDELVSGGYLKVTQAAPGSDATVSVDIDGTSGTSYSNTTVVTLTNLDPGTTVNQILNQIIVSDNNNP